MNRERLKQHLRKNDLTTDPVAWFFAFGFIAFMLVVAISKVF